MKKTATTNIANQTINPMNSTEVNFFKPTMKKEGKTVPLTTPKK